MILRLNLLPLLSPADLETPEAEDFAHALQEEWAAWDRERRETWPQSMTGLIVRFNDAVAESDGFPCVGPVPCKETLEMLGLLP